MERREILRVDPGKTIRFSLPAKRNREGCTGVKKKKKDQDGGEKGILKFFSGHFAIIPRVSIQAIIE